MVAVDRDLKPVVERRVVADRDARTVGVPAVRCLPFAVAGQRAEGADAPFHDEAGERRASRMRRMRFMRRRMNEQRERC